MKRFALVAGVVAVLVAACGGNDKGAEFGSGGSFSPVTLSNGVTVDLYTPQGWSVTDYSASGLIADTEEDTIYAMIDPARMDIELLMAAGGDDEKYEQYQDQLKQGGLVNILFTPEASCGELLADLDDSSATELDSDFLDNAFVEGRDVPETDGSAAYKMQSVRGLVPLGDGRCVAAQFGVFDPDADQGSDVLRQIATESRVQQ